MIVMQQREIFNSYESEIDQMGLMQALSMYFSGPNPKPMPQQQLFKKNAPLILNYLYPYFSSRFNKQKLLHHLTFLVENKEQVVNQLLNQDLKYRKSLLNRYLSLYSVISNFNSGKENVRMTTSDQTAFILTVVDRINQLDEQQQIFVINKIILLNFQRTLIGNQHCMQILTTEFYKITKPHKIFQRLLIEGKVEKYQNIIRGSLNQQVISRFVPNMINSLEFNQSHALIVVNALSSTESLKSALLNCLLIWWSKGDDSLSTKVNSQFKTNCLAIVLQSFKKQQLIDKGITAYLSEGVHRRIGKDNYLRKSAVIIWVRMAQILGFDDSVQDYVRANDHLLFEADEPVIKQTNNSIEQPQSKDHQSFEAQKVESMRQLSSDQEGIQQQSDKKQGEESEDVLIQVKPPRNIYDCILGLRNPARRKITLKYLPSIMIKHPDDLTLSWLQLARQLIAPLREEHLESLVTLFTLKPLEVIEIYSERFFKSDCTTQERVVIMEAIRQAVEQLASNPQRYSQQIEDHDKDFYFQKVKSTYYNEQVQPKKKQAPQKDNRTRRWGHTRIAHQRKTQSGLSGLVIINNDPYINRLYQIVNAVFFKMVSKLPNSLHLLRNQEFVKELLLLLASFVDNIKNHLEKYSIVAEVTNLCNMILTHYRQKQTKNILSCIQVLLKISLVIDKYVPQSILASIGKCVELLVQRKQYGINPWIELLQQNIYANMKIYTHF